MSAFGEGSCLCNVQHVGLTWEDDNLSSSHGDAKVTSTHFIWIPHELSNDNKALQIPLKSIVAVDREARGLLKKKQSVKVTIRVDGDQNPTENVLHSSGIRRMVLKGDENLGRLYHQLHSGLVLDMPTLSAYETHEYKETIEIKDERIAQIMELGYDERVVSDAISACGPQASAEQVAMWLLDNEVSLKLQQDYDSGVFKLGQGGIRSVFSREYKKLAANSDAVHQGLMNQESLNAWTEELDRVAHEIFDRKRLNGLSEDDIMEDMLFTSMLQNELIGCIPKDDLPRDVYIQELSRQIGHVLLMSSQLSYGVVSVSEGYRLFNRSRLQNVVGPCDFIEACIQFQRVSVPLTYSKDSNAIFSQEPAMEEIRQQIISCVNDAPGASRVYVSTKVGVPVGIVKHYLDEAEKRQLIVRDEKSPQGLVYYKNTFDQFS